MNSTIKARYFRSVIGHPKGAVVHHGDCDTYRCGICTCGLIHDLIIEADPKKIYPEYYKELAINIEALDLARSIKEIIARAGYIRAKVSKKKIAGARAALKRVFKKIS